MVTILSEGEYRVNKPYFIHKGMSLMLNKYVSTVFDAVLFIYDSLTIPEDKRDEFLSSKKLQTQYKTLEEYIATYKGTRHLKRKKRAISHYSVIRDAFPKLIVPIQDKQGEEKDFAYWCVTTELLIDMLGLKEMKGVNTARRVYAYQRNRAGWRVTVDDIPAMRDFVTNAMKQIVFYSERINSCVQRHALDFIAKEAVCGYTGRILQTTELYNMEFEFLENIKNADKGIYGLDKTIAKYIVRTLYGDCVVRLQSYKEMLRDYYYNILPGLYEISYEGRLKVNVPVFMKDPLTLEKANRRDHDGVASYLRDKIVNDYIYFVKGYTGITEDNLRATRFSIVHYSKFTDSKTINNASSWVQSQIPLSEELAMVGAELDSAFKEGGATDGGIAKAKAIISSYIASYVSSWTYRHSYLDIISHSMYMGVADFKKVFEKKIEAVLANASFDERLASFILKNTNLKRESEETENALREYIFVCKEVAMKALYVIYQKDTDLYFTITKPMPTIPDSNTKIDDKNIATIVAMKMKEYFNHPLMKYDVLGDKDCTRTARKIVELIFNNQFCSLGLLPEEHPETDFSARDKMLTAYRSLLPLKDDGTEDELPPATIRNQEDMKALRNYILSTKDRTQVFLDVITSLVEGDGVVSPLDVSIMREVGDSESEKVTEEEHQETDNIQINI